MFNPLASWLLKSPLALAVGSGGLVVASTTAAIVLSHDGGHTAVKGEKFVNSPSGGASGTGGNGGGNTNPKNGNGSSSGTPGKAFTMTVDAVGTIGPGQQQTLNVTISNPNNQNMQVTGASGVVNSVSKTDCLASWFAVEDWAPGTTPTIAPANGTTVIQMKLDFIDAPTNQDVCKSNASSPVTIGFTLHATGTQA
jgi:hypothetical protein